VTDCELHLPADVQYVGLARLVVTAAARNAGMAEDRVEDLRIAVSEATANAISAHQRGGSPAPILLSFGVSERGRFEVLVVDAGVELGSEEAAGLRTQEWRPDEDLGVTLIRGLADDVEFTPDGDKVDMRFAVGLDGEPPGDEGT
jgi:serine/threonine-protein kinase RsbW